MTYIDLLGEDRKWKGQFQGDNLGNIWQSWNLDLEKLPSKVKLANRMITFKTGIGVPFKFIRTNATATDQWFALIHNADITRNGNSGITSGTWATDDTTGTFDDPRDAVVHEFANGEQRLLCSRATDIAILNKTGGANVWDDDWWTAVASGPALTSLTFHPLARLQRLVAVGDKSTNVPVIHTLDKNDVVSASRLSFGGDYTVRVIYTSSNRFWIGLQNDFGGPAKIVEWDGFSPTYNYEYELQGSCPLTGFIVRDVPYFITELGLIQIFNGRGFEVVQDFSLREQNWVFSTALTTEDSIQPYGAHVEGDIVYLNVGYPVRLVSAANAFYGARRGRSGIWIFNTKNLNLYHHMSFGEFPSGGSASNFGCGNIALPGAVIKAPVGSESFLIAGARIYTGGATWVTNTQNGFYQEQILNASVLNRGYFITPYLIASEVEAMWSALWLSFRDFVDSSNRLIVRWRTSSPRVNQDTGNNRINSTLKAAGTWVNTTSFTSVVPTGVAVGDEVEVVSGDNAGSCFKISTLSATPDNSATITVTISEAAAVSSTDTALFIFDNWTSETAISDTTLGSIKSPFTAPAQGEKMQFKIELRGREMEIADAIAVFKELTKIESV